MHMFKCVFTGKIGPRDEIRAEVYYRHNGTPGVALNNSLEIAKTQINGEFAVRTMSIREVALLEHNLIRIHRIHRVVEGEPQEDGSVLPLTPLTISPEDASGDASGISSSVTRVEVVSEN